jgi:hypothetical protein
MMYQLLCGHVNYALGKTRMPVKKNKKDTLFWIHVYINILKIIKSYLTDLLQIRAITKLLNTEQSSKGKGKTHKSINRQNHSTTVKLGKPQWPY